MITVSKHEADPILRFIVFTRPTLPWLSIFVALAGAMHIHYSHWTYGLLHLLGTLVGICSYLVTKNERE